jgi:hypothetical protein
MSEQKIVVRVLVTYDVSEEMFDGSDEELNTIVQDLSKDTERENISVEFVSPSIPDGECHICGWVD